MNQATWYLMYFFLLCFNLNVLQNLLSKSLHRPRLSPFFLVSPALPYACSLFYFISFIRLPLLLICCYPFAPFRLHPSACSLPQTPYQAPDSIGPAVRRMVSQLTPGQVMMLENVRFYPGEQTNDPEYCRALHEAVQADVFVNDAFGTAHRAHASVVGMLQ